MAITKIRGFTQVYSGSLEGIQLSQSLATKHGDQGKRQGYLDTGMNIPFHGDLPTKQHAPVGGILLSSSLGPSGEASSSKLVLDPMWKPTFHGGVFTEDVYVSGSITAYQFIVSASQTVVNTTTEQHRIVLFQSGSTKFGDTEDDQHAFTGSLLVSGSSIGFGGGYDGDKGKVRDFRVVADDFINFTGSNFNLNTSDTGDTSIDIDTLGGIDVDAAKSIHIHSSENAADSIVISSSAGGIDITAEGAAGEDIDIKNEAGSVNITSGESVPNAIVVNATAGGIDITATGAATEDIDITNTGGSVHIQATEDITDAVTITSTAGGIDIDAASDKDIDISGGQVLVTSKENTTNAIELKTNVGTSETINLENTLGNASDAISITSTAGGIDIDANASADVTINAGQILIESEQDVADAVLLKTDTGTSETINVANVKGTGEAAITISSVAGGVSMSAANNKDVVIGGGQVKIRGEQDTAGAISLTTDAGTSETIFLDNQSGTGLDAINIDADSGGIDIDAAKEINIKSSDFVSITGSVKAGLDSALIELSSSKKTNLISRNISIGLSNDAFVTKGSIISATASIYNITASDYQLDTETYTLNVDTEFDISSTNINLTGSNQVGIETPYLELSASAIQVTSSTIDIDNAGTGLDSIKASTAGGIDIDATKEIDINSATRVNITGSNKVGIETPIFEVSSSTRVDLKTPKVVITGDIEVGGNNNLPDATPATITLGNTTAPGASTDILVVSAEISSSLIPDYNASSHHDDIPWDLGSSTKRWRNIYTSGSHTQLSADYVGITGSHDVAIQSDDSGDVRIKTTQRGANPQASNYRRGLLSLQGGHVVISGSGTELGTGTYLERGNEVQFSSSIEMFGSTHIRPMAGKAQADLFVEGDIISQNINLFDTNIQQTILSDSGSTNFGNTYDDIHSMTGSFRILGYTGSDPGSYGHGNTQFDVTGSTDVDFNVKDIDFTVEGDIDFSAKLAKGLAVASTFKMDGEGFDFSGTTTNISSSAVSITGSNKIEFKAPIINLTGSNQEKNIIRITPTAHSQSVNDNKAGAEIIIGGQLGANSGGTHFKSGSTSIIFLGQRHHEATQETVGAAGDQGATYGRAQYDTSHPGDLIVFPTSNGFGTISSSLIPGVGNKEFGVAAFDLGSSKRPWRNLYLSGSAYLESLGLNSALLAGDLTFDAPDDNLAAIIVKSANTTFVISGSNTNIDFHVSMSGELQASGSYGQSWNIGSPEPGGSGYPAGLYTDIHKATPIGTPVDRYNIILKELCPKPAPVLDDWSGSLGTNVYLVFESGSGKFQVGQAGGLLYYHAVSSSYSSSIDGVYSSVDSYGAVNATGSYLAGFSNNIQRMGAFDSAKTSVEFLLNADVDTPDTNGIDSPTATVNYGAYTFGGTTPNNQANAGKLVLELNGQEIVSYSLDGTDFRGGTATGVPQNGFGGTNATGNGSTNTSTTGFYELTQTGSAMFSTSASLQLFQQRRGKVKIFRASAQGGINNRNASWIPGWNYARVIHRVAGNDDIVTNYCEWVYDDDTSNLAVVDEVIDNQGASLAGNGYTWISGIAYNKTETGLYYNAKIENVFANTFNYSGNNITFSDSHQDGTGGGGVWTSGQFISTGNLDFDNTPTMTGDVNGFATGDGTGSMCIVSRSISLTTAAQTGTNGSYATRLMAEGITIKINNTNHWNSQKTDLSNAGTVTTADYLIDGNLEDTSELEYREMFASESWRRKSGSYGNATAPNNTGYDGLDVWTNDSNKHGRLVWSSSISIKENLGEDNTTADGLIVGNGSLGYPAQFDFGGVADGNFDAVSGSGNIGTNSKNVNYSNITGTQSYYRVFKNKTAGDISEFVIRFRRDAQQGAATLVKDTTALDASKFHCHIKHYYNDAGTLYTSGWLDVGDGAEAGETWNENGSGCKTNPTSDSTAISNSSDTDITVQLTEAGSPGGFAVSGTGTNFYSLTDAQKACAKSVIVRITANQNWTGNLMKLEIPTFDT